MPFGFGKRQRQAVEDYDGDDGDYNRPPEEAFQSLNQNGGQDFEEEYDLPDEGQFAGTPSANAADPHSTVGMTAAERLSIITNSDNTKDYKQSIRQKKRRNCCMRIYLVLILAAIGLGVGLFFLFGGKTSDGAKNVFIDAWKPPAPTPRPTRPPTIRPSVAPSAIASDGPSQLPTAAPSLTLSTAPSRRPTDEPTASPTRMASEAPSASPTPKPTEAPVTPPPTDAPTQAPVTPPPTDAPTLTPVTPPPTDVPTITPTSTDPVIDVTDQKDGVDGTAEENAPADEEGIVPNTDDNSDEAGGGEVANGSSQGDGITTDTLETETNSAVNGTKKKKTRKKKKKGGGDGSSESATTEDGDNTDGGTTSSESGGDGDGDGESSSSGSTGDTGGDEGGNGSDPGPDGGEGDSAASDGDEGDNGSDAGPDGGEGDSAASAGDEGGSGSDPSPDGGEGDSAASGGTDDNADDLGDGGDTIIVNSACSEAANPAEHEIHQIKDHVNENFIPRDNLFEEESLSKCEDDTELATLYLYDSYGDGWGEAKLAILEVRDDGEEDVIVYKGGIPGMESENTQNLCLGTNKCYRILVNGGKWMHEIRWGIGHSTVAEREEEPLAKTVFSSRDSHAEKATLEAPADCTFSLYGSCTNSCAAGYAYNPCSYDASGKLIDKEKYVENSQITEGDPPGRRKANRIRGRGR